MEHHISNFHHQVCLACEGGRPGAVFRYTAENRSAADDSSVTLVRGGSARLERSLQPARTANSAIQLGRPVASVSEPRPPSAPRTQRYYQDGQMSVSQRSAPSRDRQQAASVTSRMARSYQPDVPAKVCTIITGNVNQSGRGTDGL